MFRGRKVYASCIVQDERALYCVGIYDKHKREDRNNWEQVRGFLLDIFQSFDVFHFDMFEGIVLLMTQGVYKDFRK